MNYSKKKLGKNKKNKYKNKTEKKLKKLKKLKRRAGDKEYNDKSFTLFVI